MNDFDRFLETELKLMLDPVVARRPPARGGQREAITLDQPVLSPVPVETTLVVEAIPVVVSAGSAGQL